MAPTVIEFRNILDGPEMYLEPGDFDLFTLRVILSLPKALSIEEQQTRILEHFDSMRAHIASKGGTRELSEARAAARESFGG